MKVVRVSHWPIFPIAYTCPTQLFSLTSWLHQKLPWSFFLYSFVFFFLCSYWQHLISSLTFLKKLEDSRSSLSLSYPWSNTKRKKKLSTLLSLSHLRIQQQGKRFLSTLSSSLPLILLGPATSEGRFFHARVILFLFPPRTRNLVRVLATLILESMISSRNS